MNKTVKKLDGNVVKALTLVCEQAKQTVRGFEWLTHSADYANFPASLVVTCVLDTQDSLDELVAAQQDEKLRKHIQQALLRAGILLKDARRHVCFDTEEACLAENKGSWKTRLV